MRNDAVTDFAERVAATYGARPRHHGRELRVYCPVHEAAGDAHNPSLAIWDRGGGLPAWKCMTGCPKDAVKAALKARGVAVGNGPVSVEAQLVARRTKQDRKDDATVKAFELVKNASRIEYGDAAHLYLQSRGLSDARTERTLLRSTDPLHSNGVALMGVVCDLRTLRSDTTKATGVQTLSLNPDGTARLKDGKKLRSILGVYQGFGVPFGDPWAHTLLVAEGIESTLAATKMLPPLPVMGVAVLSASNMPALIVPEWIARVIIAADNDDPGIKAAHALKRAMDDIGMPCAITMWGEAGSGWDAADELKRRNDGEVS